MTGQRKIRRNGLRVIQGGKDPAARFGPVLVVVAPPDRPPFPVEALVLEEDTFLVLSAEPIVVDPPEEPMRLMTRLIETRPEIPGTVLVRERNPVRMLAVVHDVNREPSWREDWVARALEAALETAEQRGMRSVGLEMLGCMHGRLDPARFASLLKSVLAGQAPCSLRRIWLMPSRKRKPGEIGRCLREAP